MEIKRIAHRGFSSEAPENTRASFALAVEGDFYGVECDIWKCKDGTYVVSHDSHLQRMCGIDRQIPDMTYEEIRQYPIIRGKRLAFYPKQYLIRFTEYLSLMKRSLTIHPVIELKMNFTTVELREIVGLVEKYGLLERAFFISLHKEVLIRLKEEIGFPPERLQYVYGAIRSNKTIPVGAEVGQWLIDNRIHLDTRYTLLSEGNVMRLHAAGIQVNVWTVNKKKDMMHMLKKLKVDMVTTEFYHKLK